MARKSKLYRTVIKARKTVRKHYRFYRSVILPKALCSLGFHDIIGLETTKGIRFYCTRCDYKDR